MRALIRVFLIVIQNSHFFGKVDMSQYETPHNNSEFKIRNSKRVTFSDNKQHYVCYECLFEKSRGIAGSSFLAFFKFSLIHILFPLWYKTEFARHF